MQEPEFTEKVLGNYCHSGNGLTFRGFCDWIVDQVKETGDDKAFEWLKTLGYDNMLYQT